MTEPTKQYRFDTLAVHAGWNGDPATDSTGVPVYRTTAYNFANAQDGADRFGLRKAANIYARLMNPTEDVLEKRLAALDGGVAALALSSGTAAIYFSVTNIVATGQNLVAASNLYGGTYTQFDVILPQSNNIHAKFVKVNDFAATEAAIDDQTRAIFVEAIGNPGLDVADLEGYAKVAQKYHLPLIVDATFATPALEKPIQFGANVVIHSLSKWIGGHGAGIGGIAIDGGNFDWTDPKFSLYNEPDRGYHGIVWSWLGAAACAPSPCATRDRPSRRTPPGSSSRAPSPSPCASHATPKTPARSPSSSPPTRRSPGSAIPDCPATHPTRWRRSTCPTAKAAWSSSASRAEPRKAPSSWTTSSSSSSWPMSATPAASPSTRPPPPTHSSPRNSKRPEDWPPSSSGSPSASRTRRTSSRILPRR